MNCEQLKNIPPLSEELTQECISFAEELLKNKTSFDVWYHGYETKNKNSLSYVEPGTEYDETNGQPTGGAAHYLLPIELSNKINEFYEQLGIELPMTKPIMFIMQFILNGNFLGPHLDDPSFRTVGHLYILQTGGSNVRTKWYDIKDEFKHCEITNYAYVPYSRLIEIEDHKLEEGTWVRFNFSKIHSVENIETLRIGLAPAFQN